MKTLASLLFAILISLNSKTQEYIPFPEDSAYWTQFVQRFPGVGADMFQQNAYLAFRDTIISGKKYRLVEEALDLNWDYDIDMNDITPNFAFRNDSANKIVYAISFDHFSFGDEEANEEFVWYDFNLELGDTLNDKTTFFNNDYGDGVFTVDSIDSVNICGRYHKKYFSYGCTGFDTSYTSITEGIGNSLGKASQHSCFYFETYATYDTRFYTRCHPNFLSNINILTSSNEIESKIKFSAFPNPTSDYLNLDIDNFSNLLITDLNGKTIREITNYSSQIDVSNFKSGLYFLSVETNDSKTGWTTFVKK